MKKILFVIAMEKEAKDIAKELGLVEKKSKDGKVFEKDNLHNRKLEVGLV